MEIFISLYLIINLCMVIQFLINTEQPFDKVEIIALFMLLIAGTFILIVELLKALYERFYPPRRPS